MNHLQAIISKIQNHRVTYCQMPPKRISSKVKNMQLETKALEDQTKRMEEKLSILRNQVQEQKKLKQAKPEGSTINRWKKATGSNVPLRDYAKKVLADRKQVLNKYGIDEKKITGAKSFEPALTKIKNEKREAEDKNPTKIPLIEATDNNSKHIKKTNNFMESESSLPIQSIQNNFFKAKIQTQIISKRKSLEQFLEQHYLLEYLQVLRENDINDLDDLYHLSRQKMGEMGIKSGHQVKIVKRVKEQITNPKKTSKVEPIKQNETNQKVSFGYGDGDINEYQEIAKQQQLLKNQQQIKHDNDQNVEEQFNKEDHSQSDDQEEDVEEQYQDEVLLTVPFSQQTNTNAGEKEDQEEIVQFVCFQCYRKGYNCTICSSDGREFCSQNCLQRYLKLMQKRCAECDQIFYKFQGFCEGSLWFCSLKCVPNRQDVQQMFLKWHSGDADTN